MTTRVALRSWVDVLLRLIDRAPGPAWLAYGVLVVLSVGLTILLLTLDGKPIDGLSIAFAAIAFTPLAVMHYINRAAIRALEDFEPALGDLKPEYPRLERRLASTSFATGIVAAALGVAVATIGTATVDGAWGVSADNSVALNVVTFLLQVILNATFAALLLHEIGHLRTIARIHRDATGIQLSDTRPHNAFAKVTALTAIAMTVPYLPVIVASALTNDDSTIAVVIGVVAVVFASILFVAPLAGMRRRLVRERERQLSETDGLFEQLRERLRVGIEADDLSRADETASAMNALAIERERLRRVSALPWSANTLRAFLTTLGVPILLWFATTTLGRLLYG